MHRGPGLPHSPKSWGLFILAVAVAVFAINTLANRFPAAGIIKSGV